MNKQNIEEIIESYVNKNITEEIKEEFINAAVHFIINEDNCSQYDIMRIKYRLKKVKSTEVLNYIKLCSTYGYIIYRSVLLDLVNEEIKAKCCEVIIELSNEITKFVTMEIDEEELYNNIQLTISKLYISEKCDKLVINKFKECEFSF